MMYNLSESHISSQSGNSFSPGMRSSANKCLCYFVGDDAKSFDDDGSPPRCAACVQRSLQPHWDRHVKAIADRDRAREDCARLLETLPNHNRLGELQAESQRLRDRLTTLRKQCGDMAVRVASQAVENDSHREAAQLSVGTDEPQHQLERLEQSLLQGSLHHALDAASRQVRVLRFQWARKALAMHRLDIDPNDVKLTPYQERESTKSTTKAQGPSARRARGIGKIGGLPLPHAGPELYGVLPPKELQSALRLVASVTCTVARCLGIVLPHPILLTPTMGDPTMGDITDTVPHHELQRRFRENHHASSFVDDVAHHSTNTINATTSSSPYDAPNSAPTGSSSILSLMDTSYWKRSAKKALARATGHSSSTLPSNFPSSCTTASLSSFSGPSMDSSELSLRIHHATAAVLAEDSSSSSSKFALSAEMMHQDDFTIALQLLQNNVIVLCIRAGVPVFKLWPAEAVLLNLHQLDLYCQEQTAVCY